jgi:predicted NUDIX family phosphoesterase
MEEVLVVPRTDILAPLEAPLDRFHPGSAADVGRIVARRGRFVPRQAAEEDPAIKQIIPYAILVCGDQVFLLRRTAKGGEARLHERVSLGVGGHINRPDAPGGDLEGALETAFRRELDEEVIIETRYRTAALGVVNDDATPVGAVHLGVVYRVDLEEPRVRIREEEALTGRFVRQAELLDHRQGMETWSWLIARQLWFGEP